MTHAGRQVQAFGQSLWLDYINRKETQSGEFARKLAEDGVLGVTSNPTIFQQVIGDTDTYDDAMRALLHLPAEEVYEQLAVEDIQAVADLLRPIYDSSNGRDGYVSLEVSPLIASDTAKTISEAKRLFERVARPNLMIKIPATPEGIPAIEEAIFSGINVNVTLIFSVSNYEAVAEAYIRGLERRAQAGLPVTGIASVASFFLSRIDTAVDRVLENNIRSAQVHADTARIAQNNRLLGQAAIANAKLAYASFQRIFYGTRFAALREAGAQVQRPLWASTGTKNPAYSDTRYVDLLIGKDTVNTLPPKTLAAFVHHGTAVEGAILREFGDDLPPQDVFAQLAEVGIDMDNVTKRLQDDGVDSFVESFQKLIDQVRSKLIILKTGLLERYITALGVHAESVNRAVSELESKFINARIWGKDGSVWKDNNTIIAKIVNRLGWLDVLSTIDLAPVLALREEVRGGAWSHVVLLGMGGSSLAPEVLYKTFGRQEGFPEFLVLDSTDPARIDDIERAITLKTTLFIVASKSGGTVETLSFYKYFYALTGANPSQFIAITDPESELAHDATAKGFAHVFLNPADIGGRYSALSYFGLVPAALMGLDVERLWDSARTMIEACSDKISAHSHVGLLLGALMGALGKEGHDKLAIHTTASIASFGDWVEQLVAESIGKEGRGIVPVVGATVGKPHDYVSDRVFVYLRVDDDSDVETMDAGIRTLREAGHARVTIRLADKYALAGEFFRWEYATAIAGHLYGVNPFDEPNVTEAKDATKALLKHYEAHGALPEGTPFISGENTLLYADETTIAPLRELARAHNYDADSRKEFLASQIASSQAGDYFALLAYLNPTAENDKLLRDVQRRLRHVTKRAVTVGYGPRYLHSTGQLHKGGANNGIFFVITADIAQDKPIPDAPFSFGTLYRAQALGDFQALQAHKRRAIRLHIGSDIERGLQRLLDAIAFVEERRL
jgi:transaldolase/glucose-6-phosphate isomerase